MIYGTATQRIENAAEQARRGQNAAINTDLIFAYDVKTHALKWTHQGQKLLPDIRGKDTFFQHCIACHGFQSRMAMIKRDEDGWRSRVAYMRDAMTASSAIQIRIVVDAGDPGQRNGRRGGVIRLSRRSVADSFATRPEYR